MKIKLFLITLLSTASLCSSEGESSSGGLDAFSGEMKAKGRPASRSVIQQKGTWFDRYCCSPRCASFFNWMCCRKRGSTQVIEDSASPKGQRAQSTDLKPVNDGN